MLKIHKHLAKQLFHKKHKIELNSVHLDDIDDIYSDIIKESIKMVGFFRFINFSIGLIFLLIFIFVRGTVFGDWLFVVLMSLMCFYNLVHCYVNYKRHRKIKRTKNKVVE